MATFAVFEPPLKTRTAKKQPADGAALAHAERFRFVRDGFSWLAFLFGPVWMLCHRLWLAFVCYCVVIFAIAATAIWFDLADGAVTLASIVVALLVGFEAATLRRRKLLFWRWRDAGIVVGRNRETAESRFFDRWVTRAPSGMEPETAVAAAAPPVQRNPMFDPESYVIGMYPPKGTSPRTAAPEDKS